VQPRLHVAMAHPRLGMGAVSAPAVPGPLQAPAALLRYGLLPVADRVRLFAGALRLAARSRRRLAGETVSQALAAVGQSEAACERFWHPLAIATLNEAPEVAAAAPFVAVLRRGFFAGAKAARFVVARVPLSEVYTTDARAVIERAGGRVLTGTPVTGLVLGSGGAEGVVVRDGSLVEADAVILAVPCAALLRLLPPGLRDERTFRALAEVGTSPIVSTHLWLDRPVTWGSTFLGLLASRAQWLFDCGPTAAGGQRVASVTSGARFWDETSDEEIAREVMDDARAVLPGLRAASCLRAHVIRERHATLSLTPAADARRPSVETTVRNLFLAGDWIQTGLPATIEGAVQSGRRAADLARQVPPRQAASREPGPARSSAALR